LAKGNFCPSFFASSFDERDVTDLVEPDEDAVVEDAVGQAALHDRPGALDDVEVRQGVAVVADQDAGAAALAAGREDGHDRRLGLLDRGDALALRLPHAGVEVGGPGRDARHEEDGGQNETEPVAVSHGVLLVLSTEY
jgi:hypothetical protein